MIGVLVNRCINIGIMSRNFLSKNDELFKGDRLVSGNGEFKAIFQDDGNFVVYGPVWASDTAGSSPFCLIMQDDCNLVMYDEGGKAMWHTNTSKSDCNLCHVLLTDEGKLVVKKEQDEVWNSDKSNGMKSSLCSFRYDNTDSVAASTPAVLQCEQKDKRKTISQPILHGAPEVWDTCSHPPFRATVLCVAYTASCYLETVRGVPHRLRSACFKQYQFSLQNVLSAKGAECEWLLSSGEGGVFTAQTARGPSRLVWSTKPQGRKEVEEGLSGVCYLEINGVKMTMSVPERKSGSEGKEEESEDESEILEESPCGRWQKRKEQQDHLTSLSFCAAVHSNTPCMVFFQPSITHTGCFYCHMSIYRPLRASVIQGWLL
ncbi:hypothetical protein NQZ68_013725 [Dissostichus eleginoides]|nr:hypothetical protein NQZ68_013725 [Dissostichus eleginoides]